MESLLELITSIFFTFFDELFNQAEYNKKKKGSYVLALAIYLILLIIFIGSLFFTLPMIVLLIKEKSLGTFLLTSFFIILSASIGYLVYHYTLGIYQLTTYFFTKK